MDILKSKKKKTGDHFYGYRVHALSIGAVLLFCMTCYLPARAQGNTGAYQVFQDTAGFLGLDRNGNPVDFSGQPDLIAPLSQQVNSAAISLPFDVFFMGSTYTSFMVNVNGCVVLAPSAAISLTASLANNYTSVNSQYTLFAPFWDVLKTPASKGIKYTVAGVAPYRSLIIEWYAVSGSSPLAAQHDMQFQFRLYESTNIVEYVYGKMQTGTNLLNPITASIGFSTLSAGRDSSFISVMRTDSFYVSRLRSDLTASQNLVNTSASGIIKGLHNEQEGRRTRFAFVPEPMLAPGNLTAFNVTANNALLYWDDYSSDELGFKTYRVNKLNEPEYDTTLAPNISFRDLADLLPGTTYQYRVQVYNNYTSAYSNVVTFRTNDADTLRAVKSGNWNDTATWGGFVPGKNTVVEIPASLVVKFNVNEARCHQVFVYGSLTFADQSAAQKLYVNYDVINYGTISAYPEPSYNNTGNEIILGRDVINNQVLTLYKASASYTNAITLRFTGNDHSGLTGNGDTTNVYALISDKTGAKDSLTINPLRLTVKGASTDTESNGALLGTSTNHTGIVLIGGNYVLQNRIIGNRDLLSVKGFTLIIDNPSLTATFPGGDITINGSCALKLKQGTAIVQGSLQLRALASLVVEDGELNISNQLKNFNTASDAFFTQSGGRITTAGLVFNSAKNSVNLRNGVLVTNGDAQLLADLSASVFGTHKLLFGTSGTAIKQYSINGSYAGVSIDSLVNTSSTVELTLNGTTTIHGALYIGSNDTMEIGAYRLTLKGDTANINGALQSINPAAELVLASTANNQVITGNGTIKVNSLEISKDDTLHAITFALSDTVRVNQVGFYGGKIVNAAKLKIGEGAAKPVVRIARNNSIGQGSILDATPVYAQPERTYIEYNEEFNGRATGFEIPQARKLAGVFFNNSAGIVIQGGSVEVSDTLALLAGKIETSQSSQVVLTDTVNPQALKVNSGSYFNGPFTRSIPANQLSANSTYEFPVGKASELKAVTMYQPLVNGNTVRVQAAYHDAAVEGTESPALKNLQDTGYWQLAVVSNTSALSAFKIAVYDQELTSRSKLALAKSNSSSLGASDLFNPAGERVSFFIDSLRSDVITSSSATDSFYYFTKAELVPDTLSKAVYRVGQGEDFENLTAVAKQLSISYIDSTTVFEITQNYSPDGEVFPVGFEQMWYTNSEHDKAAMIRMANNVTGIVTANTKSFANGNALINFYGADDLTFDGMGYDALGLPTGRSEWSIQTASSTMAPVIRFAGDASGNRIVNLKISGSNNSATSGIIEIGPGGKSGNDRNVIENNTITSLSTSLLAANHIISSGLSREVSNDENRIINNRISDFSLAGIHVTASGNGPGWAIEENTIFQSFVSAANNTAINFIPGQGSGNHKIRRNLVGKNGTATGAWNYSGTAALSAIVVDADAFSETVVSDNLIRGYNLSSNGTANGLMAITARNGNIRIVANTIGGLDASDKITIAGRGLTALIRSLANSGSVYISDNVITNIDQSVAAGTTNKVRAISAEGTATVSIINNNINNITGRGASIDYKDASVTGIYLSGTSQGNVVRANSMYNLNMGSTGYITGISVNGVANGVMSANNIYNITNASTTTGRFITGVSVEYGSWLISNNKITITNTGYDALSVVIQGLRVSAAAPYQNKVMHNTVYIGGTTAGTTISLAGSYAYYQAVANAGISVFNNLFVNTRGSANIHPAAYTVLGAASSDFNHYYARTASAVISTSGTLRTFLSFQSLSGSDKNSTADIIPAFNNIPENITPKDTAFNCFIKGTGTAVNEVTTDYAGKSRNASQPDLGADEFTYTSSPIPSPVLLRGNDTLCSGETRTLYVNAPAAGDDVQWFDQAAGGNLLFTGFDFATGNINSDTVFYVQFKSGTCKSYRTAVPVKVKPTPGIQLLNVPQGAICGGNSVTLETQSSPATVVSWFTDSTSLVPAATGNTFTSGILFSDTAFYAEASNGICPSVRKKISIDIDNTINIPLPSIDTLIYVCKGSGLTLEAGSDYSISWYASQSGSPIASDSILYLEEVLNDTFYYVAAHNGSCISPMRKVQVKVNNAPVLPVMDSAMQVCGSQPIAVSLAVTEGTVNWFAGELETVPFHTGAELNLAPLDADSIFYYEVANGTCASTARMPLTIKPIITTAPLLDPLAAICKNTGVQLSITNPPLDGAIKWYTSLNAAVPVYTGNSFAASSLINDTIFYVETEENNCASKRVAVPVTVVDAVDKPVLVSSDSICKGSLAELTVSSPLPVSWYADALSGNVISSDYHFTAGILSADSVFYVAAQNGSCRSPLLAVKIRMKPAPQPPLFTPVSGVCAGSSVALSVSAGDSVKWYASLSAGTPLVRGNEFTTPKLNTTTTYYLETDNGTCRSKRVALAVPVLPAPNAPLVAEQAYRTCFNERILLKATSPSTINWYATDLSTVVLQRDSVLITEPLQKDTVFYAESFDGYCRSPRVAVPVLVLNYLGEFRISLPDSAILDQPVTISSEGMPASIYSWEFGSGASLSGATGLGPFNLSYSTSGEKVIRVTVSRRSGNLTCDTVITRYLNVVDTANTNTGLGEAHHSFSRFNAYPNPAKEILNVSFQLKKASPVSIQLTDLTGRILWQETAGYTSQYEKEIDVRNYIKGIYLIRVMSSDATRTHKIIIE